MFQQKDNFCFFRFFELKYLLNAKKVDDRIIYYYYLVGNSISYKVVYDAVIYFFVIQKIFELKDLELSAPKMCKTT